MFYQNSQIAEVAALKISNIVPGKFIKCVWGKKGIAMESEHKSCQQM